MLSSLQLSPALICQVEFILVEWELIGAVLLLQYTYKCYISYTFTKTQSLNCKGKLVY